MDHILGHKTSSSKFKKTKVTSSIFPNHSGMKLEISYTKKTGKKLQICETKQRAPEQPMRIKEENMKSKTTLKQMQLKPVTQRQKELEKEQRKPK